MKKLIVLFSLVCCLVGRAQDAVEAQLEELYYQEQYDKIISKYAAQKQELSAVALYYVGRAYYMKDQEDECIAFMDLSIEKDPEYPLSHFIKGYAHLYKGTHTDATTSFNAAIALEPDNYRFYNGLGDSYYYQDKYPQALEAYQKAMLFFDADYRSFYMAGLIYIEQKQADKALQVFFAAKEKTTGDADAQADVLFKLGNAWMLKQDYAQAEAAYNELAAFKPDYYSAYSGLIQLYFRQGQYEKAAPLRTKLYEAFKSGKLINSDIEDRFCYDEFTWGGYTVYAYERYETGPGRVSYDKHLFYFVRDNLKTSITVVTAYVPGSEESGAAQYELCAHKGSLHFKGGGLFSECPDYESLKAAALKMAEEHLD